jgi:alkylation response protein AidB-like acyl-CoA dehydrogenase
MTDVVAGELSELLTSVRQLAPLIRQHADEAEQNHRLSQPVVTALAQAGIFRMCTPRSLGGFEVHPLTFYRVVEEIARLDGSTGWCVFIAGCNPMMGAYLADGAAKEVFGSDPHVTVAGVVLPYGKAVRQPNGYVVSGHWSYGSGCQHCAWLFCTCHVYDDGQLRLTPNQEPEVRAFFVPTSKATILETWDVSGLAGTGSHDVVIEEVFVPEDYTCAFGVGMTPSSSYYTGPLYRFPLYAVFALPISAVALGIAQGAIDACLAQTQDRAQGEPATILNDRPLLPLRLSEAIALVRSARAWLHTSVQNVWESMETNGQVSHDERADILLAAANATRSAATAVDLVYTMSGARANFRRNPLQRALRDIHAVTQHMGTAPQQFESAGRMLLGLPPLQPLILI